MLVLFFGSGQSQHALVNTFLHGHDCVLSALLKVNMNATACSTVWIYSGQIIVLAVLLPVLNIPRRCYCSFQAAELGVKLSKEQQLVLLCACFSTFSHTARGTPSGVLKSLWSVIKQCGRSPVLCLLERKEKKRLHSSALI